MARDDEILGIRPEELFQGLWIPPGNHTNCIGSLALFLTIPEILPKMAQVIEGVRIEMLLHGVGPLLVRDGHISDRPPERLGESFDNLAHGWSFAHEQVYVSGRQAGTGQKSCGHAGYIFGAGQGSDGVTRAPRQECGILRGHAAANQRADVLVIERRLNMNGPDLRPVEDAIGQPMLQISE